MRGFVAWCVVLTACGGGGSGGDDDDDPAGIDTYAPSVVRAGQTIPVVCLGVDTLGGRYFLPGAQATLIVTPAGLVRESGDGLVAETAGQVAISCSVGGQTDASGVVVEIQPGPPALATIEVDDDVIVAGEDVTATCRVRDAFANDIADASPTVIVTPRATGTATTGMVTTITRAGAYYVACHLDGVDRGGAPVAVTPALPASLRVMVPGQQPFGVSGTVGMFTRVEDRYGNPIAGGSVSVTAQILSGSGPINDLGNGAFQFGSDGVYRLTATVPPPTDGNVTLSATEDVTVNGNGPAIDCFTPGEGRHVDTSITDIVDFSAVVSAPAGIQSVTIDGTAVTPASIVSKSITARYGVNAVHIVVTDSNGVESDHLCSFTASPSWLEEREVVNRVVTWAPKQGALATVVAEAAIAQTFFGGLFETIGPLITILPTAATERGSEQVLDVEIGSADNDVPTLDVQPRSSGVRLTAHADGPRFTAFARGERDGTPFEIPCFIDLGGFDAQLDVDIRLDGSARLTAVAAPGSDIVTFGDISFGCEDDQPALEAALQPVVLGNVRTMVAEGIRDWLARDITAVIGSAVTALDLEGTDAPRTIDRLDGIGTLELDYASSPDPYQADTTHGFFGLATEVDVRSATASDAPIVVPELPDAVVPSDGGGNAAVALHLALIGQVLHALWRGGYYDGAVDAVTARVLLPPVVSLQAGARVVVDLGAVHATVTQAGVFDAMPVVFSVRAGATIGASGGDLVTSSFAIDELTFAVGDVQLDASSEQTLDTLLRLWAQTAVTQSLADAFSATPAPTLGAWHFSPTTADAATPHLILQGNLTSAVTRSAPAVTAK